MPKKTLKSQRETEARNEWFHACLSRSFGDISIETLDKSELERLAIAAIREHRHLLERAQKLHEQVNMTRPSERAALTLAYAEAQRAHDDHHIIVHMLIGMLGYVPKFEEGQTAH